jgi:hypothetical protein
MEAQPSDGSPHKKSCFVVGGRTVLFLFGFVATSIDALPRHLADLSAAHSDLLVPSALGQQLPLGIPQQQSSTVGSVLEIKPMLIPRLGSQTVSGEFEGCWEGTIHNPDSCQPRPCNLGTWIAEKYEFCFVRQSGDILAVTQAKGSFCGRSAHEMQVDSVEAATIRLSSVDNGSPGCELNRRYTCILDGAGRHLSVREIGQSRSSGTEFTWHSVFHRGPR